MVMKIISKRVVVDGGCIVLNANALSAVVVWLWKIHVREIEGSAGEFGMGIDNLSIYSFSP